MPQPPGSLEALSRPAPPQEHLLISLLLGHPGPQGRPPRPWPLGPGVRGSGLDGPASAAGLPLLPEAGAWRAGWRLQRGEGSARWTPPSQLPAARPRGLLTREAATRAGVTSLRSGQSWEGGAPASDSHPPLPAPLLPGQSRLGCWAAPAPSLWGHRVRRCACVTQGTEEGHVCVLGSTLHPAHTRLHLSGCPGDGRLPCVELRDQL